MALIKSIKRSYKTKAFRKQQAEVDAEFYEIGNDFVQIQTYSSAKSKTGSRSQTIRLTKEVAKDLADLIYNAFENK